MEKDQLGWANIYEAMWMLRATELCLHLWRIIAFGWGRISRRQALGETKTALQAEVDLMEYKLQGLLLLLVIYFQGLVRSLSNAVSIYFCEVYKSKIFYTESAKTVLSSLWLLYAFLMVSRIGMTAEIFDICI